MKLQDAYASETNALGEWAKIGYQAPGGNNFTYAENSSSLTVTCKTGTLKADNTGCEVTADDGTKTPGVVSSSTYTEAWSASNIADLNSCKAGKNWLLAATIGEQTTATTTAGTVSYAASIASTNGDCTSLTPNFTNIGK